jgi:hypothetical protein
MKKERRTKAPRRRNARQALCTRRLWLEALEVRHLLTSDPLNLVRQSPLGSLVSSAQKSAGWETAGEIDSYAFDLSAGDRISVREN